MYSSAVLARVFLHLKACRASHLTPPVPASLQIDPALEKKNRYNKSVSLWCHVYIHAHFALAVLAHQVVLQYKHVSTLRSR